MSTASEAGGDMVVVACVNWDATAHKLNESIPVALVLKDNTPPVYVVLNVHWNTCEALTGRVNAPAVEVKGTPTSARGPYERTSGCTLLAA